MAKLDPRLRHLLRVSLNLDAEQLLSERISEAVGVSQPPGAGPRVDVIAHVDAVGSLPVVQQAGLKVYYSIPAESGGLFVGGEVALDQLSDLEELDNVLAVEASRRLDPHLDLSRAEARVTVVQQAPNGPTGQGVLVGLIDGGIDFTHPDFRTPEGKSRLLFLWDQGAAGTVGDVAFGREYTKTQIDEALAQADPFAALPHRDRGGHGTAVAGVTAGRGAADAKYTGMAPGAELVVVVCRLPEGSPTSDVFSARALAAYDYIRRKAIALARPVVINQSQGMNGGGHSGETLLERALDNLLRMPGVVAVKAAGNEGNERTHAGGTVAAGETVVRAYYVLSNKQTDDLIELWYGDDELAVGVEPPGAQGVEFVSHGHNKEIVTQASNKVSVDSEPNAGGTGDTRVTVIVSRGTSTFIQPGTWRLHVRGDQIKSGRFDAWIERSARGSGSPEQSRFRLADSDPTRTLTIPGTGKRVLTVGSYVTRTQLGESPPAGQLSESSSRGPTRYELQKPDLAAPGEWIMCPQSSQVGAGAAKYALERGTSFAAPHVAGAIALLLERYPSLSAAEVAQILTRATRREGAAASVPNELWGSGKLDVARAFDLAAAAAFPKISQVVVDGTKISWKTDIATTGAVRYHTHKLKLQLGKDLGSRVLLTFATAQTIDLAGVAVAPLFCEINAFSADNWRSTDDNDGKLYQINPAPA